MSIKQSMFNEREAYTQPAKDLSDEVSAQMKEWLDRYAEMGFSRREIESVCIAAIGTTTSEEVLKVQLAARHENSR